MKKKGRSENNIIIATNQNFITFLTRERVIKTAYFLKRRKIQRKIKYRRVKAEVLAKYRDKRDRVLDIYHKVANKIVKVTLETNSAIALASKRKKINQSIKPRLMVFCLC